MKLLNVFIVLVFLQNCSFDNKTGIWKNEKNFSKKENNIFKDFVTLGTENETFNSIIPVDSNYKFKNTKAINNYEWKDIYYDQSNNFANLAYNNLNKLSFKSNKISRKTINDYFLSKNENIITTDQSGNIIVYSLKKKEVVAKYNFYKKKYKKVKKSLNIAIEENKIFVADNIGYLYSFDYKENKVLWAKKYKVGFRSNVKISNNKLITSSENNDLIFFNKKNGDIIKLIPTEETIIKNQFVNNISINNNISFFLNTYGSLYAINNVDMKIIWFLNLNQSLDLNPANLFSGNQIVADKNKIFVSTNQHTYIIEQISGTIIHRKNFSSEIKPIILNDYLITITKNDLLVLMNINNGKIIYSYDVNQMVANFLDIKKKKIEIKNIFFVNNKIMVLLKNSYVIYFNINGILEDVFKLPSKMNTNPIIINKKLLYFDFKNKLSVVD
jgi:outer membrane protein assembly factor BamB